MTNLNLFPTGKVSVQTILHGLIYPDPQQPRREFDPEGLAELAGSIQSMGLLSPILVTPNPDGTYMIVYGERRWRAAKMAGLKEIPCLVADTPFIRSGTAGRTVIQVAENDNHRPLTDLELIDAIIALHEKGMTEEEISKQTGKRLRWVRLALQVGMDREIRMLLETGIISGIEVYAHFASLPGEARRELLDTGDRITSVDCARMRDKYRAIAKKRQENLPFTGSTPPPTHPSSFPTNREYPSTGSCESNDAKECPPQQNTRQEMESPHVLEEVDWPSPYGMEEQEKAVPRKDEAIFYLRIPSQWLEETDHETIGQIAMTALWNARARGWRLLSAAV